MTELDELDERIAKFKKELAEDGILAKDWAKWDAEHEGYGRSTDDAHHAAYQAAYDKTVSAARAGLTGGQRYNLVGRPAVVARARADRDDDDEKVAESTASFNGHQDAQRDIQSTKDATPGGNSTT